MKPQPNLPVEWPADQITAERARCAAALKGLDIVAVPEAPVRHGECGAAAPIRLISIGRSPEVAFSPPPLMTCDLAVALHGWIKRDLQPLAVKHLGARLIRIETMSDYSCRNAYGRTQSRLSEHARANALDIRGFVTARGVSAAVLSGWGPTGRDVRAEVATATAKLSPVAPRAAAAAKPPRRDTPQVTINAWVTTAVAAPPAPDPHAKPRHGTAATVVAHDPKPGTQRPLFALGGAASSALGPSHLGGPRTSRSVPGPQPIDIVVPRNPTDVLPSGMALFLRDAHRSACRVFGTALGPEADRAHLNHFHVDLAQRPTGNYCQ